jgi:hypothetical protein
MSSGLLRKIAARLPGISLYGVAPPKASTPPAKLAALVDQQVHRLNALDLDGLIVYDIQDEAERVSEQRPFPFLPTLSPDSYAHHHLAPVLLPKIVYHCVSRDSHAQFVQWLEHAGNASAPTISVLVGAASRNTTAGLQLAQAYELARTHAPQLLLGGIAIAERHAQRLDEHERMLAKHEQGCRFFVTQAVYDVTSTLSLLSDYARALATRPTEAVPIVLTFSPCGSLQTLAFMKWLGITFPRWLENELRFASDPLATSLELCERIFSEVWDYARDKGLPVGINVESVSIRKLEIDASVELLGTLQRIMQRRP